MAEMLTVEGASAFAVPDVGETLSQVPPDGVATETLALQAMLDAPSGRN